MSKQACAEFFAKVNTDTALQQDFLKAIEGKEDESMLMDAARSMVEVGTKYGYDFTNEEVAQTYKEIKEKSAMEGEGGELEEEALEMVAGGGMNWKPIEFEPHESNPMIENPRIGNPRIIDPRSPVPNANQTRATNRTNDPWLKNRSAEY